MAGPAALGDSLDQLADRLQQLADRALPAARRLAAVIRVGGVLGWLGGLAGAIGLALPGVGIARSWPFFLLLVLIASGCAAIVLRWGSVLRAWSGDVRAAVQRLHDLPAPGEVLAKVRSTADDVTRQAVAARTATGGRNAVLALVRAGAGLRRNWRDVPQLADRAKDLSLQLTGPFRPPLLGLRLAMLGGGLCMVVIGPLVLLVAVLT